MSYASADRRCALQLLWQIDERLAEIVAAAREPAIGAMRLIWWRDALAALDMPGTAPPAEPLLVAAGETFSRAGVSGEAVAAIEEGWAALLDQDVPGEREILVHGERRGGPLFEIAASILGAPPPGIDRAGEGWALADLGHRLRDEDARRFARARAASRLSSVDMSRWPSSLRALGLLILLARQDAAMPADRLRRQGSPKRMFRALAYRLTGR